MCFVNCIYGWFLVVIVVKYYIAHLHFTFWIKCSYFASKKWWTLYIQEFVTYFIFVELYIAVKWLALLLHILELLGSNTGPEIGYPDFNYPIVWFYTVVVLESVVKWIKNKKFWWKSIKCIWFMFSDNCTFHTFWYQDSFLECVTFFRCVNWRNKSENLHHYLQRSTHFIS